MDKAVDREVVDEAAGGEQDFNSTPLQQTLMRQVVTRRQQADHPFPFPVEEAEDAVEDVGDATLPIRTKGGIIGTPVTAADLMCLIGTHA